MLMVKAKKPVDDNINALIPLLNKGDLIIDGGNSYFKDTIRRNKKLQDRDILYIGTGVSGGEEGALLGPVMMPGAGGQDVFIRNTILSGWKIYFFIFSNLSISSLSVVGSSQK